jgi:hypothetical protein
VAIARAPNVSQVTDQDILSAKDSRQKYRPVRYVNKPMGGWDSCETLTKNAGTAGHTLARHQCGHPTITG